MGDKKLEFSKLVSVYDQLDQNSSRLSKTYFISEFLKTCDTSSLQMVVYLLQGKLFANSDSSKIGIATSMAIKAIASASGHTEEAVISKWKETGDLGECSKLMFSKKKQATLFSIDISVKKVFENLRKLATITGNGTNDVKLKLIAELLTSANGDEAKYIIRLALGDLRVGVGDGALRDALVWGFLRSDANVIYNNDDIKDVVASEDREQYNEICEKVMHGFHMVNDFSEVALLLKEKGLVGLDELKLTTFQPLQVMLCQKAKSISDAFDRVGTPCIVEHKYDGFRINIHKQGDKVELYTRRLENVTKQFPDVVKILKDLKDNFIVDGEVIGYDKVTGKYLAFQQISTRIRRKYDIEKQAEEIPVELVLFDIMSLNGESLLDKLQTKRREVLESLIKEEKRKIMLSKKIETSDEQEASDFYNESLAQGNEGVIFKSIDKKYQPGSRVGFWVKYKPVMQELDLVITKAQYGEGKRAGWFSSFTVACRTEDGEFLELGNVGTGIKEKAESEGVTFEDLTNLLKPLVLSEDKNEVTVKPKVIVEIAYEEIQKSSTYSSGYALRFPRVVRLRDVERDVDSVEPMSVIEDLYFEQRGRNN